MYFKICLGRGMTNANIRFASIQPNIINLQGINDGNGQFIISNATGAEFTKVDGTESTDLFGFIFVPYDDGQYSVHTTAFKAINLPGMKITDQIDINQDKTPDGFLANFEQVGDLYGAAISFLAQGIGDGISDMLDETNFFVSFATSKTDPNANSQMLGMTMMTPNGPMVLGAAPGESKTGTSWYTGLNWPCQLIDDARVGVEYNHGSQYWRSFTYAEDTLAGSKLAARGDAYEIWFNKDLIGKTLTAQVRYTYIDYKYTGSNGFFANGGTPLTIDQAEAIGMTTVDKAQDIRFYIRYRY